ncbi:phosphoribosylformylglycinamidine synthase [Gracilibacillus halotolerans]|uniref:Phosphoribosylformylglycinamidine synthase subunit PurS n=1 Tax=Gracilibacillus halotolerans TaxID=74386 RepID=A0A841RQF8_9BACI|nr:phosphoribosylformylglycinamidine synthase subunit PurS [Gracilibacillus halotolerans]MBB6514082.1 phosphoribosylformylglycinamidine synthase [Gracilibacillus halotolerans]
MKIAKIHITLKEGVLDPQGKAVQGSLHSLGFPSVEDVRVGKYIEIKLAEEDNAEKQVEDMCNKLLANPVVENYSYTIEEVVTQ